MNMHATTQPQRTQAETALFAAYEALASDLPGNPDVTTARGDALALLSNGLPTRRVEAWHYTDLRRLLSSVPERNAGATVKKLSALLEGSTVLTVANGLASTDLPRQPGVTFQRLEEKLQDGSLAPAMVTIGSDDAIGALNVAFVADGYCVDVAAGTKVDAPIELQNIQMGGQTHSRFPVNVGDGATVMIVERQTGEGASLSTSVSHLTVGEGANVTWLIIQDLADTATYLGQFNAEIGKDAQLNLFFMNAGGKLVRQEVRVGVKGEGSDFQMRGVNLLSGAAHTDVTMVLDHTVPNTGSRQLIRNVVTDKAHGVFQGRINVHQIAQKTDAKMACNTLLLSDDGEFSSKPELEIFADDVQCGHGATVKEIDHNHLFYLMARGIDERSARGLLIKAFLAEVIEELEGEAIIEALEQRLEDWFAKHG
ncbi:Fe-S cluster assembly protein SufD [Mesorhizobium sp. NBSH29]|uniref:Fe-S cluster assembly protein SufD n=1 Tax=Mesorhizobium sp. NBSH29 TaxID=2654249 RepID=UPI0018964EF7|nr:Fe-S cluster assembly protein SufD [Mesorhizobium sp. NBSH29]QPC87649.1 Fe-S cluster assembly protein SufD [Mesorhizobium sp. NBSH29]